MTTDMLYSRATDTPFLSNCESSTFVYLKPSLELVGKEEDREPRAKGGMPKNVSHPDPWRRTLVH